MFEKLLIQMLYDGPDLTYSPSRFVITNNFEDILHDNLLAYQSEKQRINQLTLVSIYKSLNLNGEQIKQFVKELLVYIKNTFDQWQKQSDRLFIQIRGIFYLTFRH
jgi:hypothetical protein